MSGTKRLDEILSPTALAEVKALIDAGKGQATHLRVVLAKYRDELLAKGVDSDYLAYAIEYLVSGPGGAS